eukprot:3738914-Amphidinium_carterae.1
MKLQKHESTANDKLKMTECDSHMKPDDQGDKCPLEAICNCKVVDSKAVGSAVSATHTLHYRDKHVTFARTPGHNPGHNPWHGPKGGHLMFRLQGAILQGFNAHSFRLRGLR